MPIDHTSAWNYLYPQDGIDPGIADPDFDSTWFDSTSLVWLFDDSDWDAGSGQFAAGNFGKPTRYSFRSFIGYLQVE